jgi:hypothetical protein
VDQPLAWGPFDAHFHPCLRPPFAGVDGVADHVQNRPVQKIGIEGELGQIAARLPG